MSKITVENWKEHKSEMRRTENGKCWHCNAIHKESYSYDTMIFYECEVCGHEICIDFSGLMSSPMFGTPLADEWKAEEKAASS